MADSAGMGGDASAEAGAAIGGFLDIIKGIAISEISAAQNAAAWLTNISWQDKTGKKIQAANWNATHSNNGTGLSGISILFLVVFVIVFIAMIVVSRRAIQK